MLSYRDILNELLFCQHADHKAEKKKALSNEAKRLYRKDPGLFKAAEEDFKSISFINPSQHNVSRVIANYSLTSSLIFVIQSL